MNTEKTLILEDPSLTRFEVARLRFGGRKTVAESGTGTVRDVEHRFKCRILHGANRSFRLNHENTIHNSRVGFGSARDRKIDGLIVDLAVAYRAFRAWQAAAVSAS